MKFFLSILLLIFFASPASWLTDFQKAQAEALQSHKIILLNFSGSDWCIPCIRLHDQLFSSEVFTRYADSNLVLVNADFPRLKKNKLPATQTKQNDLLADQYNKHGIFPLTLLVSPGGKVMKEWEGYPDMTPGKFVQEINAAIHNAPNGQ